MAGLQTRAQTELRRGFSLLVDYKSGRVHNGEKRRTISLTRARRQSEIPVYRRAQKGKARPEQLAQCALDALLSRF